MPWVRLDDRFTSHRKVALLSDRAFRLYVAALCWCSENLTEGRILERELPVITRIRGAKTAATELEKAGLWDREDGGWSVHDYLEYNPDRARVQADREANAARQKAWRDRKKAERGAQKEAGNTPRNGHGNGVTDSPETAPERTMATPTRHDGDTNARETRLANQSSPQVNEVRNAVSNGTPSRPLPLASPTEKQASHESGADCAPDLGPEIPTTCRPLVDALTAAGVIVRWNLSPTEWFTVEALIAAKGLPALAAHAQRQAAARDISYARYFLAGWRELPPLPAPGVERPALRAVPGTGWQPYRNPTDHSDYQNGW